MFAVPSLARRSETSGIAGAMFVAADNVAACDIRERLVHMRPCPGEVVPLLDCAFGDPLIDKLACRLFDRGEVAARHMGAKPSLLFRCERNSHFPIIAQGNFGG